MKRILALLCAILMLSSSVVACGNSEPAETTAAATTAEAEGGTTAAAETAAPETEAPKAFDTVPAQNLGGEFYILYGQADECFRDFYAETLNGDIKNDLIYERNSMVEEKLGIDIKMEWMWAADVDEVCKTQVQAGAEDYDLFGGHRASLALGYQGFQYNLADVSTLDLTQEWWDQGYLKAVSINDSVYTVIGDAGLSTLLFVSSLAFNKRLMDESNIAYPYDLVREGKWTLDALLTMTTDFGADLNGDGKMVREDDLFALLGWAAESSFSMFYSGGFSFVNRNAEGDFVLEYDTSRLSDLMTKVTDIWLRDNVYIHTGTADGTQHTTTYNVFKNSRALFVDIVLSKIGTFYSEMTDDFGIVPTPKYDEEQKDYYSYLGYTIPVLYLAANTSRAERTGTVMEAFSTASYDHVTPQMYEIVTKLKNVRDEDSSEMIEIIIRNKFIDTAHFFDIEGYGTLPRTVITSGSPNFTSTVKTFERVAKKEWDKIIESFNKLS